MKHSRARVVGPLAARHLARDGRRARAEGPRYRALRGSSQQHRVYERAVPGREPGAGLPSAACRRRGRDLGASRNLAHDDLPRRAVATAPEVDGPAADPRRLGGPPDGRAARQRALDRAPIADYVPCSHYRTTFP